MFWNNKLIEERNCERNRADTAIYLLDSKSRECERLIASAKTAIDESAKCRQLSDELQAKLDASTASLEKFDRQLAKFLEIVHEVRLVVSKYSAIELDSLKNNSALKNKLSEAQTIIEHVQEKTKVERQ